MIEEIKTTKDLMRVWMEGDAFDKPRIFWEFGGTTNCYFLIGILEDMKQELIKQIDEESDR